MLTLLGPTVIATRQTEQMSMLAAHMPGDTVRDSFGGEHRGAEGMVSRDISLLMTIPDSWTDPSPVTMLFPSLLAYPSFRILQKQVLCMRLGP